MVSAPDVSVEATAKSAGAVRRTGVTPAMPMARLPNSCGGLPISATRVAGKQIIFLE